MNTTRDDVDIGLTTNNEKDNGWSKYGVDLKSKKKITNEGKMRGKKIIGFISDKIYSTVTFQGAPDNVEFSDIYALKDIWLFLQGNYSLECEKSLAATHAEAMLKELDICSNKKALLQKKGNMNSQKDSNHTLTFGDNNAGLNLYRNISTAEKEYHVARLRSAIMKSIRKERKTIQKLTYTR